MIMRLDFHYLLTTGLALHTRVTNADDNLFFRFPLLSETISHSFPCLSIYLSIIYLTIYLFFLPLIPDGIRNNLQRQTKCTKIPGEGVGRGTGVLCGRVTVALGAQPWGSGFPALALLLMGGFG